MKQNNKKGLSLVELMASLVVLTLAMTFAIQLFYVGAKATSNSKGMDDDTKAIVQYFETADPAALSEMAAAGTAAMTDQTSAAFSVTIGGVSFTNDAANPMKTVTVDTGETKTTLSILKNSMG